MVDVIHRIYVLIAELDNILLHFSCTYSDSLLEFN